MRILELFIGMPFHAFFGIAIMMANSLLVGFFAHPPAGWRLDAMADQNLGGGIAWAFSEVPTVLVLLALLMQWYSSDRRSAARIDRKADRDNDADLAAYNAYLARLAAHDTSR